MRSVRPSVLPSLVPTLVALVALCGAFVLGGAAYAQEARVAFVDSEKIVDGYNRINEVRASYPGRQELPNRRHRRRRIRSQRSPGGAD
ncbi:MAG: hypothetical protein R3E97_18020 [Candidatus Eisenbacteria bacterium]